MELKIWCGRCEGTGTEHINDGSGLGMVAIECSVCEGEGYTNPPQEILDDLECAEIERELLKSNNLVHSALNVSAVGMGYTVLVGNFEGDVHKEVSKIKLEALRKAKEWLDTKGGGVNE